MALAGYRLTLLFFTDGWTTRKHNTSTDTYQWQWH